MSQLFKCRGKRLPKLTLLGAALAAASGALAQNAPASTPTAVTSEVRGAAYVDQVIEGLRPDDSLELKASAYNDSGWPRSLRVDYSLFSQSGASRTQSQAIGLSGFVETPNYGAISVNANLFAQRVTTDGQPGRSGSSTWRVDQRGVPLSGGWRANYNAGNINTAITPLGRGVGRVSLPSSQIRGIGAQWYEGDQIDINASTGQTGLFSGISVTSFETTGGQISTAGAQIRVAPGSTDGLSMRSDTAVQVLDGRQLSDSASINGLRDTRATWLSSSLEGLAPWATSLSPGQGQTPIFERVGGLRLQGNLVQSASGNGERAIGLWADAKWRSERWRQTAGVYRFEPNLRWGPVLLAGDLQGLYWQADTATRQWQTGFSAEISDSVQPALPGSANSRSAFVSLNGRYQLDTANSLGSVLSLRALNSPGQSLLLNWNHTGYWGQTQWRGDLASSSGVRTVRVGVDQSWAVTAPTSFNTSLALERVNGGPDEGTGLVWGLLGRVSPWSQWSLDASLRGAARSNGSESINVNAGLVWRSYDGWSLALAYTESRGRDAARPLLVSAFSAAVMPPLTVTAASRSLQLLLSYTASAGSANPPIGGLRGSGSGSLSGIVYYDVNANGTREASEGGVAGVTVILDRRYVTRTDVQGRYEYGAVVGGEHLIEISSDNVPLPWSPLLREPIRVILQVREATLQDFAVQREP